jgi:hypothetical protein
MPEVKVRLHGEPGDWSVFIEGGMSSPIGVVTDTWIEQADGDKPDLRVWRALWRSTMTEYEPMPGVFRTRALAVAALVRRYQERYK